jgi:ATP-dependent Clp protease ATP-binding subunit ClpA
MMLERLDPDAQALVQDTVTHAFRLGHNYVGTEHFLLALVDAEEKAGAGLLVGRGVTVAAVEQEVRAHLGSSPTEADALRAVGVDPEALRAAGARVGADVRIGGLTQPDVTPGVPAELARVTPRARTILAMAGEATSDDVGRDQLLAAMLDEGANLGVVVLERLGVSIEELRAEI